MGNRNLFSFNLREREKEYLPSPFSCQSSSYLLNCYFFFFFGIIQTNFIHSFLIFVCLVSTPSISYHQTCCFMFHSFLSFPPQQINRKKLWVRKKWQGSVSHESRSGRTKKSLHFRIWQGNRKCMQNVLLTWHQFSRLHFSGSCFFFFEGQIYGWISKLLRRSPYEMLI